MHFTLTVFLCFAQFLKASPDPPVIYKLTNIECVSNDKYITNISCSLKAVNWNKAVAQMDCDLVLPLRNPEVRMELQKKGYNNRYHPFLVNVTMNMCDVISNRNYIPYGRIYFKISKEFSNLNHSCPITGHLMARNMWLNEKYIPVPMPLGFYVFSARFSEKEEIGFIKFYFEAKEPKYVGLQQNYIKATGFVDPSLCMGLKLSDVKVYEEKQNGLQSVQVYNDPKLTQVGLV
ncbi:uncharacterized protein LOC122322477 [Drosophila grimshawi]|uniref:uncharacterized protein LOC122322477 n=1 Tax=Drosophila grimshawi TaxID=7222 RepID=UPI001C936AC9|nr:uncharacterized protein LOC122322477 [Drosophila grimshawi]